MLPGSWGFRRMPFIISRSPLNRCCKFPFHVHKAFPSFYFILICLDRIIPSMDQGQSKKFALQWVKDKWCPPPVVHDELALLRNRFTIYHIKSGEKNGVKRLYSIGCNGELLWSIRWIMCILKYCVNTYFYNSQLHFQRSHCSLHLK